MPKLTRSQRTGFRGEDFVGKVVSDAGHIWQYRPRDFGIDGDIEMVDRTGQVSGLTVKVQVKSTEVGHRGEAAEVVRFVLDESHIDYWLRDGRPVILVYVDVKAQLAWWKRLDTWFADPLQRSRRTVEIDKREDVFDPQAVSRLAFIAAPTGQLPPRLTSREFLTSNLLEVEGFAPLIYSASTPCRERGDAWERMRSNGAYESGFLLSRGRIYSMVPLEDSPLAVLCDGPTESHATSDWSQTDDPDLRRRFVALLNYTLRAMHYRELVWHVKKQIVYYQAPPDLSARRRKARYKGSSGRSFFKPYHGRDDETKTKFCRHYAAGLYFDRWRGSWFLEINPTYHFTLDGKRDSLYDAEYIAKIKRLERNSAVCQLVRAWADLLKGDDQDTLFERRDDRIRFGDLLTVEVDVAIDEKVWIPSRQDGDIELQDGVLAGLPELLAQ